MSMFAHALNACLLRMHAVECHIGAALSSQLLADSYIRAGVQVPSGVWIKG